MPIFQKHEVIPIDGYSESELVEVNVFWEAHGISKDMLNQSPVVLRNRLIEISEKCINENAQNKAWIYYFLWSSYFSNGKLKEMVALCSRANLEYPSDPRAYYCLGIIYEGIFQQTETDKLLNRANLENAPWEIRQRINRIRNFEQQNPLLIKAFREQKLVATSKEAAESALNFFRKALSGSISNEDKSIVQARIRLIEQQLSL